MTTIEINGHDLARTFDCKTASCTGAARSRVGRHAYCVECQVRRGTRTVDGGVPDAEKARRAALPSPQLPTPTSPTTGGSASGNLSAIMPRPAPRANVADGSLAQHAAQILPAAKRLDAALARRRAAKDEAERALADFKDALEQLHAAANELLRS